MAEFTSGLPGQMVVVRNTTIYRNTILTSKSDVGNPAAVDCMTEGICNICFYNNTFKTDDEAF